VAVSGAAGAISNHLLFKARRRLLDSACAVCAAAARCLPAAASPFRAFMLFFVVAPRSRPLWSAVRCLLCSLPLRQIASGEVFGPTQPVVLQMLGSETSFAALEGVAMELEDSLFPLLRQVTIGVDMASVYEGADWALLVGAKPRGPGMERRDLLDINGQLFQKNGIALNESASADCKVVVVGNPCNTNALIALRNAPRLNPRNFSALTRLDENRAKCQARAHFGAAHQEFSDIRSRSCPSRRASSRAA